MGRLHALALAAAATGACQLAAPPAQPPVIERAVGVQSEAHASIDTLLEGMCDVHHTAQGAPRYDAPEASPAVDPGRPGAWTWVNYWATWCGPCVREFPLLLAELSDGPIDLVLLSTDDDSAAVTEFGAAHAPGRPLPIAGAGDAHVAAIGRAAGLGDRVGLPLHVIVDPDGGIRCARVGEVSAADVRALVGAVGGAPIRRIR